MMKEMKRIEMENGSSELGFTKSYYGANNKIKAEKRKKRGILQYLTFILIITAFGAMLAGCSYYSTSIMDISKNTETGFMRSCKYWTGDRIERVETETENVEITISMVLEKGTLEFKLVDSEGTEIDSAQRDSEDSSDITIMVEKPGKYSLISYGKSFAGEYEVSWK